MNVNKLKKLFILCLIGLLVLIMATSCNFSKLVDEEEIIQPTDTNIEGVHKLEKFDYNNLSDTEKSYLSDIYSDNIMFTNRGVEVYFEGVASGKLNKIITSTWPQNDIGNFIPEPDYGELDRIEYAENWINIYINNAKKSDVTDYLKKVKEYDFTKNEEKDDGKALLRYKVYDEEGNSVQIIFYKKSQSIEISAKKVK